MMIHARKHNEHIEDHLELLFAMVDNLLSRQMLLFQIARYHEMRQSYWNKKNKFISVKKIK